MTLTKGEAKEVEKFTNLVKDNDKNFEYLMDRLYDEFEYEKEEIKAYLRRKFSTIDKYATVSLKGKTFTVKVILTKNLMGIFKLNLNQYSTKVLRFHT